MVTNKRSKLTLLLAIFASTFSFAQTNELYDPSYPVSVLERKVEIQTDSIITLEYNLEMAKRVMLKEMLRKKIWAKVAIGEAVFIAGAVIVLTTGVWVPVVMAVGMIELYLVTEGQYRLNIFSFKKLKPPRWKMEKKVVY